MIRYMFQENLQGMTYVFQGLPLDSRLIAVSNLISWMRQKFDLNVVFTFYTNSEQNIKFEMALYNRILAALNTFNVFCYNVQC